MCELHERWRVCTDAMKTLTFEDDDSDAMQFISGEAWELLYRAAKARGFKGPGEYLDFIFRKAENEAITRRRLIDLLTSSNYLRLEDGSADPQSDPPETAPNGEAQS